MNYLKDYCNLIRKAEHRVLPEGYTEKHHIFPISIFGKNNRTVVLTAREHYISHALLEKAFIKRYGLDNIKTQKMIYAFWCMNSQKTKNEYLNSHLYESSKIRLVGVIKNRKITEEQRKKQSIQNRKKVWWTDGINTKHSENCPGDNWYRGRPNINIGRVMSVEAKRKIGEKNSGKKLNYKHKEKIINELKSRKWWNNGVVDKHCPECPGPEWKLGRLKESWCKGKKNIFSEDVLEKIRQSKLKYKYTIKSPDGDIFIINNLHQFCKENNLTSTRMRSVAKGSSRHHKGWTVMTVEKLVR